MLVVHADRATGSPLFVLKGAETLYRMVLLDGAAFMQTYRSVLPRKSVVAMCAEGGGFDSNNVFLSSRLFVKDIRDLTAGGCKVLFLYDGYRSHMSFCSLKLLHDSVVVVFALPAHTSGKTQQCDVALFDVYKRALNSLMDAVGGVGDLIVNKNWAYGRLMYEAYKRCFTGRNILAAF